MNRLLFCSLMGLVCFAAAGSFASETEGMPVVFTENFEDGDADGWAPTDPEAWKVIDEGGSMVYCQHKASDYEPEVRSPHNISWIEDLVVSDFVIDVMMKSTTRNYNHRDMCVFFGKQDASHFYYAHIAPAPPSDNNANKIMIVNGEPRRNIATKTNPGIHWKDETYHHVRVVRDTESGLIQVFWDDMENSILEAKDTTFKWGRIGFGTFDDTGCIDNICIRGIAQKSRSGH